MSLATVTHVGCLVVKVESLYSDGLPVEAGRAYELAAADLAIVGSRRKIVTVAFVEEHFWLENDVVGAWKLTFVCGRLASAKLASLDLDLSLIDHELGVDKLQVDELDALRYRMSVFVTGLCSMP